MVHRIDPWLKRITFRRPPSRIASPDLQSPVNLKLKPLLPTAFEEAPEKSVTLNVLYEPPKNVPIRADVVFLHGLHGSLVNTWKQGMWNSEGRRVKFDRPPKPEVRPPKRARHSRRLDAPHQFKRPRHFSQSSNESPTPPSSPINSCSRDSERSAIESLLMNACLEAQSWPVNRDMTYYCDEPETTETIDELEYSFPTFRTMAPEELSGGHSWIAADGSTSGCRGKRKKFVKTEDYSPCWPKDWLSKRFPDLRVIALNYTTDPYLWRPVWIKKRNRTSLAERTREMTDMLIENKVGVDHPIVWVGHSKGGIFIKQIIVDGKKLRRGVIPYVLSRRLFFHFQLGRVDDPLRKICGVHRGARFSIPFPTVDPLWPTSICPCCVSQWSCLRFAKIVPVFWIFIGDSLHFITRDTLKLKCLASLKRL